MKMLPGKSEIKKIFCGSYFRDGLVFGFISYGFFNYALYFLEAGLHDCHAFHTVGLPFRYYQWGQFDWMEKFLWFGAVGNLILGLFAAVLFGLFWHWLLSRKIRLK